MRSAVQRFQRDVALLGIKQPIELGTARFHERRHLALGQLLFLHRLLDLPGDDLLDCNGAELFEHALFLEELIEGAAPVRVLLFLAHSSISFMRARARSKSAFGVFRVFFMKPCTTPIRPRSTKNSTRAMRLPARSVRTSDSPLMGGRASGMPMGQRYCTR